MSSLKTVERPEYISKSDFLAKLGADTQDVDIPNFGKIKIRPMTLAERYEVTQRSKDGKATTDPAKFQVLTILKCVVEPSLDEPTVAHLMNARNVKVVDAIASAIWTLSGVGDQEKNA